MWISVSRGPKLSNQLTSCLNVIRGWFRTVKHNYWWRLSSQSWPEFRPPVRGEAEKPHASGWKPHGLTPTCAIVSGISCRRLQMTSLTSSDLAMTFSTIFRSCFMGLCLVLEPSISSSAKKRNRRGSSLNSLFSKTAKRQKTRFFRTNNTWCSFSNAKCNLHSWHEILLGYWHVLWCHNSVMICYMILCYVMLCMLWYSIVC